MDLVPETWTGDVPMIPAELGQQLDQVLVDHRYSG